MTWFRRALALLLCASVALPVLALSPSASAGDIDDPDMEDKDSDAASGRAARDLIAGWIANETEDGLEFNLKMSALEPYTPYPDWQSLPVVYYEFFFDVITPGGRFSFMARATIPMHGPLAAFATYDLLAVTYGSQGTVLNETPVATPSGRYIVNAAIISFTVGKNVIGDPARGDVIEGIWARTRSASQRNTGDSLTEDTMMTYLAPGRSYILTGGRTFYSITLAANTTATVNATPDVPARFELMLHSDSEKPASVQIRNSTSLPPNWTMLTDRNLYGVDPGGNTTVQVTIIPGGNMTDVTRRITVHGVYQDDQNETRTTENTQTLSVYYPKEGGGGGGGGGTTPKPADNTVFLAAGGVGAVGAAVGAYWYLAVFLPARRRQRARKSFSRIAQRKLGTGPRSGPTSAGPMPAGPAPGGRLPLPRPGGSGLPPQPPRPGAAGLPPGPPRPGAARGPPSVMGRSPGAPPAALRPRRR